MWDNKMFISLGIQYQDNLFKSAKNRKIYTDSNFPPTKPIEGGFWGSTFMSDSKYKSFWEKYIYEKLSVDMFKDKLEKPSTKFSLSNNANILKLESFNDIWIELVPRIESNLPLRFLPISKNIAKQYERHLFLDFEEGTYDGIYVGSGFIDTVEYILNEFERKVYDNEADDLDLEFLKALYFAEMFEDWSVESILVLNNSIINIIEVI